jgi:hypothetical protein
LWRVLGFAMLGLAAVLLIWAGLDLGHGWSPDGAKGILLRLLPIVCFLLAAAAAITKASAVPAVPSPPSAPDVTSLIAAERGAAADRAAEGSQPSDRSFTSSILGSGHAPAAPLAPVAPPTPPAMPTPAPAPAPAAAAFAAPTFDAPPTLQPGVAVPDMVSPASSPTPATSNGHSTPSVAYGFDSGFNSVADQPFNPSFGEPPAPSPSSSTQLANVVGSEMDARERHPVGIADQSVIEIYRNWVLTQTTGERAFQALDVHERYDEWFLLSASGVATLLAWTHEDHGATYSAETWVDQILPMQGIGVADRQLALDLLNAAALHAGGLHTAPTQRLMAYEPNELVTAMATVHVGLLRLYSGLEGTDPSRVLREQLGEPITTQPSLPPPPSDPQARWLPPGS